MKIVTQILPIPVNGKIQVRWEDAKRTYLKFINKIFMRHIERKSYTHTHPHTRLHTFIHYNNKFINTKLHI